LTVIRWKHTPKPRPLSDYRERPCILEEGMLIELRHKPGLWRILLVDRRNRQVEVVPYRGKGESEWEPWKNILAIASTM